MITLNEAHQTGPQLHRVALEQGRTWEKDANWVIDAAPDDDIRPVSESARTGDDADTGFALTEVVTALRSYGVPLHRSMPNKMGLSMNAVDKPPEEVIAEARARTQGSVHRVPGRDNPTRLNNIVLALNTGLPITIGTGWPQFYNTRAALLDTQAPSYSHAVTLVGYRSPTGRLEDTTFIF